MGHTPNSPAVDLSKTDVTVVTVGWTLQRDAFGKLVLTHSTGERFEGVVPVRAFPVQSPNDGIAMVNTDGKEVAWIPHLAALPSAGSIVMEDCGHVPQFEHPETTNLMLRGFLEQL